MSVWIREGIRVSELWTKPCKAKANIKGQIFMKSINFWILFINSIENYLGHIYVLFQVTEPVSPTLCMTINIITWKSQSHQYLFRTIPIHCNHLCSSTLPIKGEAMHLKNKKKSDVSFNTLIHYFSASSHTYTENSPLKH